MDIPQHAAEFRTVTLRTTHGGVAHVLGVAHISATSSQRVRAYIQYVAPDVVALELCPRRFELLGLQRVRGGGVHVAFPAAAEAYTGVLALLLLLELNSVNAAFNELYEGGSYGGEQVAAAQAAQDVHASLAVIDRPMSITLARAGAELSILDIWQQLPAAIGCVELPPTFRPPIRLVASLAWHSWRHDFAAVARTLDDLRQLAAAHDPLFTSSATGRAIIKWNHAVVELIRTGRLLPGARPHMQRLFQDALLRASTDPALVAAMPVAFTEERDKLLAHAIRACPGDTVVAVVGSAHVDGIVRHWEQANDAAAVQSLLQPPPGHAVHAIVVPSLAALSGAYGLYRLGRRSMLASGAVVMVLGVMGTAAYGVAAGASAVQARIRSAWST